MQTDDVLAGLTPEAMTKVAAALESPKMGGLTALEMYIWLKRVQGLADELMKNIVADANAEFAALVEKNPTAKAWKATDFATVTNYSPAGTWIYPKRLVMLESELKSAKEEAKQAGTAKRIEPELDLLKSAAFKVQLQRL